MTTLKPLTVWIITNCGKLLKRWEEYIEELYKKDPNEPDYYDGQSSEPDNLDNKVK